jgi:hypothetical protein
MNNVYAILNGVKELFQNVRQTEPIARLRVARSFDNRLSPFILRPQSSFTSQPRFEERLRETMTQRLCGVRILCAPEGTGKSAFLISVANEMFKKKLISGVFYIDSYADAFEHKVMHNWLLSKFDVKPHQKFSNFCSLLPDASDDESKPYLLILDQFEDVLRHPDASTFIKSLAQNCQSSKRLTVLASVKSTSTSDEMLNWNGHTKIMKMDSDVLRWNRQELESLASKVKWSRWKVNRTEEVEWHEISNVDKEIILKAVELVGTPGFLLDVSSKGSAYQNNERLIHDAELRARIWEL